MVRRPKKAVKNHPKRDPKKIILIGTEGNNKTEELYFSEFNRVQKEYVFRFAKGNDTDPVKIVYNTANAFNNGDLKTDYGDRAYSLFDMDLVKDKLSQCRKAKGLAKENNIQVIVSNPCFEVWFLMHFGYSTKQFGSTSEVIKELKNSIPDYQKNRCDFDLLYPKTRQAIDNCIKLKNYHQKYNYNEEEELNNPTTDVHLVFNGFFEDNT